MPTVTKTWALTSSAEGWTGITWSANNGGALQVTGSITPPTAEQPDVDFPAASPAGTTWLDLGVPANALAVTGVQMGADRKRTAYTQVQQWSAIFNIVNVANTTILPPLTSLAELWMPVGSDSVYVGSGGTTQSVLASYQAPSTVVRLLFDFDITPHLGPTTTTYGCAFRNFQLTITYTVAYSFPALTLAP